MAYIVQTFAYHHARTTAGLNNYMQHILMVAYFSKSNSVSIM